MLADETPLRAENVLAGPDCGILKARVDRRPVQTSVGRLDSSPFLNSTACGLPRKVCLVVSAPVASIAKTVPKLLPPPLLVAPYKHVHRLPSHETRARLASLPAGKGVAGKTVQDPGCARRLHRKHGPHVGQPPSDCGPVQAPVAPLGHAGGSSRARVAAEMMETGERSHQIELEDRSAGICPLPPAVCSVQAPVARLNEVPDDVPSTPVNL